MCWQYYFAKEPIFQLTFHFQGNYHLALFFTYLTSFSARISELLMLGKVRHCLIPTHLANEFGSNYPRNIFTSVVTLEEYSKAPTNYPDPIEVPYGDPSHLAYHTNC